MELPLKISGFPPIVQKDARILILGSMPSVTSLAKEEYYGHPRNAFWKILYSLYEEPYEQNYERRCCFLKSHSLALWDVFASCEREGSLDQNIQNVTFNPLKELIEGLPDLQCVFCNGTKSYTSFKKYAKANQLSIPFFKLPSTSPADAKLHFEDKLAMWRQILPYT